MRFSLGANHFLIGMIVAALVGAGVTATFAYQKHERLVQAILAGRKEARLPPTASAVEPVSRTERALARMSSVERATPTSMASPSVVASTATLGRTSAGRAVISDGAQPALPGNDGGEFGPSGFGVTRSPVRRAPEIAGGSMGQVLPSGMGRLPASAPTPTAAPLPPSGVGTLLGAVLGTAKSEPEPLTDISLGADALIEAIKGDAKRIMDSRRVTKKTVASFAQRVSDNVLSHIGKMRLHVSDLYSRMRRTELDLRDLRRENIKMKATVDDERVKHEEESKSLKAQLDEKISIEQLSDALKEAITPFILALASLVGALAILFRCKRQPKPVAIEVV